VDRIDRAIVAQLQKDARLSNKQLAAKIGLAASSCLERVRRLERRGVLRGAHVEVDPAALGIGVQALVRVRLDRHLRKPVDQFREHLDALPEAVGYYHLTGQDDFIVHVVARDTAHLRDLTMDAFTTRPEVARIETSLLFEVHGRPVIPDLLPAEDDAGPSPRRGTTPTGEPRR
jgi:DNA-binding Lrp family transcriptional regulator